MIAAALERGDTLPTFKQPDVWLICRPAWDCFWMLSASRPIVSTGMGAMNGRIAYTEIAEWARDHDHADTPEELDEFVRLVQKCDSEWLELNKPKK